MAPPPPSPRRRLPLLLVVIGLALVLVVGGGLGVWALTRDGDSTSAQRAHGEHGESADDRVIVGGEPPPKPLGIDDPRTPEPIEHPAGDGGAAGAALLDVARAEGFTCGRADGDRSARIRCYRTDPSGPLPTVQELAIGIIDNDVTEVSLEVDIDVPWRNLPTEEQADDPFGQGLDYDLRSVAGRLVSLVGGAVLPDDPDGKAALNDAIAAAMTDVTAELDTATFTGFVTLAPDTGGLELSAKHTLGVVSAERALPYLTARQVEKVVEVAGFTCARTADRSRCGAGDVEVRMEFPRQRGDADHEITVLEITGPAGADGAPPAELVDVAVALAEEAIGVHGDPAGVASWVEGCFGAVTNRIGQGGARLTCSPELRGTVEEPDPTAFTFRVE